ncbi:MAG: hypothetical protein A3H98_11795 [Bacteroidetes bacterium RIFCSPLOWO2_02_FULL_36_8]|nr:MAG: hypothetical protein A3H98_11795 [Bacteroidetes bacterium RIFCSPLOWO2_02_FULL_36_8]OFY69450.1 MAG: hypothetical protein A3G23_00855 [Bacteroidetes bacterium RIFCSPLOWO2_12_FULL_37_12]
MKSFHLKFCLVVFSTLYFTLFLFPLQIQAQTTISGGLVYGTWNITGSPYRVQGSIMIPADSTLTIEPGVKIEFEGVYKLLVLGKLIAVGNQSDSITFTAIDTTSGWKGIRYDGITSTQDSSLFVFCKFLYGKATGTSPENNGGGLFIMSFSKIMIKNSIFYRCSAYNGGGIYCNYSNPIISNNTLLNNFVTKGGGGICCNNYSNPVISNNTISNNTASSWGGGIYCINSSSPNISNNTFTNNSSDYGGGIYCAYGNKYPIISDNTFSNNSSGLGGGIFCDGSSPVISNNSFSNNLATIGGGGIYCYNTSYPIISNNTISNNSTPKGGGIYCQGSSPTISNNIFFNNSASADGGGLYFTYSNSTILYNTISNNSASLNGGAFYLLGGSPTLSNNAISNNTASSNGGGIYCISTSKPAILNNTISNNSATTGGGLFCNTNSDPTLRNTILWGNVASTSGAQVYLYDEASDPDFYYCDIQGGTAAFSLNGNFYLGTYQNNIDTDPFFVSPSGGSGTGFNGLTANWSLQNSSPCIDAGTYDTTGLNIPATDIGGSPRINNGRIDMGAYENQCSSSSYQTITACDSFTWKSYSYSTSGIYTDTISNIAGCDSLITLNLTINKSPNVTLILNEDTFCHYSNEYLLSGGFPEGGNYFGAGVVGNNFNPAIPGVGFHTISYSITDGNNCSDSATAQVVVEICTGISALTEQNIHFSIYPNPTNGIFKLLPPTLSNGKIKIYNTLGLVVFERTFQKEGIDFSYKKPGMYFLEMLQDGKIIYKQKIILE